jgi:tRNA (cmo5U34)-methyltransferase
MRADGGSTVRPSCYQMSAKEWASADHALAYLARADRIPHRTEGEAVILDHVPLGVGRMLDLGTGDGRLLGLLKIERPNARGVALDFSPVLLQRARERFSSDPQIEVVEHDLDKPLPALGRFDAVVSCFAIHHLTHERKRSLYDEIFTLLEPGGVFCNLDLVSSPTLTLHEHFLHSINCTPEEEDASNKPLDIQTQLLWLREIGFADVDCYWKWLELALLIGVKQ